MTEPITPPNSDVTLPLIVAALSTPSTPHAAHPTKSRIVMGSSWRTLGPASSLIAGAKIALARRVGRAHIHSMPAPTIHDKIVHAEAEATRHLGNYNAARERGALAAAEKLPHLPARKEAWPWSDDVVADRADAEIARLRVSKKPDPFAASNARKPREQK